MTHDECKAAIENVIDEIVHIAQMPAQVPKGAVLFIVKQKLVYVLQEWPPTDPQQKGETMSAERTDFVTELPINSLKTLLSVVKGQKVSGKAVGLAVDNVASYAMGQFLPDDIPVFPPAPVMQSAKPCTGEECVAAIERILPDESGTMKAGVGKADWANMLKTILPFILSLFV